MGLKAVGAGCWGCDGTGGVELADMDGKFTLILVSAGASGDIVPRYLLEGPREIPPPREGFCPPNERPSRSFSKELPPWDGPASLPLEPSSGSGSKSIRESSLFAFVDTPVVVPSVPLGI